MAILLNTYNCSKWVQGWLTWYRTNKYKHGNKTFPNRSIAQYCAVRLTHHSYYPAIIIELKPYSNSWLLHNIYSPTQKSDDSSNQTQKVDNPNKINHKTLLNIHTRYSLRKRLLYYDISHEIQGKQKLIAPSFLLAHFCFGQLRTVLRHQLTLFQSKISPNLKYFFLKFYHII